MAFSVEPQIAFSAGPLKAISAGRYQTCTLLVIQQLILVAK